MPGVHALLSPSAAKRWMSCPPSARLESKVKEKIGDKGSVYAEEGTLAHAVAELKLRKENGELNQFNFDQRMADLGDIPKEIDRFTDYYVDIVLEKWYAAMKFCEDARLVVEQRLDMGDWVPHCFGTSDAVVVSDDVLVVMDLKYGKGVPVSAIENPQARLYGLGAIHEFGSLYDFDEVHNIIIQPRLDSVTEEEISRDDLLAWGESIKPLAEAAWKGEGEFHTGEHCRFCRAKAVCVTRVVQAMTALSHSFDSPDTIRDEDIPGILEILPVAEDWIKDIRAYAQTQAIRGQHWPGYKLVRGRRPGRQWRNEEDVVNILARAGYGEDQYTETKLKSCSEMEKVLGRAGFRALLGPCVVQGEGNLTLVPESDTRTEYTSSAEAIDDLLDDEERKSV